MIKLGFRMVVRVRKLDSLGRNLKEKNWEINNLRQRKGKRTLVNTTFASSIASNACAVILASPWRSAMFERWCAMMMFVNAHRYYKKNRPVSLT